MLVDGTSIKYVPVPIIVPPHEPLYHTHCAPEPREPPVKLIAVAEPMQIESGLTDIDPADTEPELIETIALTQTVVLQIPCART